MSWIKYPISQFEYRKYSLAEFRANIPTIQEIEDVDNVFLNMLRVGSDPSESRIRYMNPATNKLDSVPVYFYNENDRLKSNKSDPFIIVRPLDNSIVEDHIRTDMEVLDNPTDEHGFVTNYSATYIEFSYRVSGVSGVYQNYRRLGTFISELLFPLIRGQRWITVSVSDADVENRRHLTAEYEGQSEDFENNNFQTDVQFTFRLAMYTEPWVAEGRIDLIRLTIGSSTSEGDDGHEQEVDIDLTI